MKKRTILMLLFLNIFSTLIQASDKFTLQPGATCGKDALIADCVPCGYYNTNYGTSEEFNSLAWTNSGSTSNHRSLIQFDLKSIPPGSLVTSAYITLFYNPISSNAGGFHSNLTGPNASYFERILDQWDEDSVTWANQPATDTLNRVIVPMSVSDTENFIVDVTSLIQMMVDDPASNFGMMLRLQDESYYRCLLFASSDHPNDALHPKLEVNFSPATTSCLELQYASCNGIDALIGDCIPCGYDSTNFGDTYEFNALAWTNQGAISNHRSLIRWDLSAIPSNAVVSSADVSFFFNPTSVNASGVHSQLSGPNNAILEKITAPWDENVVTWNNQPTTATGTSVALPASPSATADYINIPITSLVQDMVSNPTTNYGLMLKLVTESYYRCLLFASSDHPNENLHPILNVCYSIPTSTIDLSGLQSEMNIYPNPSTGEFNISVPENFVGQLKVIDAIGKIVMEKSVSNSKMLQIRINQASGVYYVQLHNNNTTISKKIVIMSN